jgi:RNA recognition motif-containing protein
MSRKLFVGNLSYNTTEDSLEGLFAQVGQVESARVMRDMATGRSRGFGFVEMQSEDDARTAIERFNDTELDGRRIAVNVAQPKPTGAGAGNRGGGGGFGGQRRREPRW